MDRILTEAEAAHDAFTRTQDRILSDISEKLSASAGFDGKVREKFRQVIALTLRFLTNRLDLGRQSAVGRAEYLFEWVPDGRMPVEADLQWDYHDVLVGSFLQHRMSVEKRDVASGRVDVEIKFDGFRFIAEIKRELSDPSPAAMAAYLAQAAEYQVTDVKLGLLLVLDLSPHAVPAPGIERCVWVSEVAVGTSGEVRHVVVFRIPGRKKRPSDQTAVLTDSGSKRPRLKKKTKSV